MSSRSEVEANKLLKRFSISESPVDVNSIATALKISISYEPLDPDISGVMLFENGNTSVAINSTHHPNRQRFTLAHEIGHLRLHAKANKDGIHVDRRFFRNDSSSKGEVKEEIEANTFAACLLMPEPFVKNAIDNEILTDFDIFKLAVKFKVSEQSMTLRLVKLKYIQPD